MISYHLSRLLVPWSLVRLNILFPQCEFIEVGFHAYVLSRVLIHELLTRKYRSCLFGFHSFYTPEQNTLQALSGVSLCRLDVSSVWSVRCFPTGLLNQVLRKLAQANKSLGQKMHTTLLLLLLPPPTHPPPLPPITHDPTPSSSMSVVANSSGANSSIAPILMVLISLLVVVVVHSTKNNGSTSCSS